MTRFIILSIPFYLTILFASAQTADTTNTLTSFSGSVGITNNGFSIIPTFSLNSPAFIANLAWQKKRFSFEPDIRLVPNLTKGGLIWWLRYRVIDNKKFTLRVGTHPAMTIVRRAITEKGQTSEISEFLRFAAFEVLPSYQVTKNFGVSAMYLEGHGLQMYGPQTTRVLFLNTAFTDLGLTKNLRFKLFPSMFFLHTDGYSGKYLTVTGLLAHKKLPFTISSTINHTFQADLPGNKDFMWNVGLNYNFSKIYRKMN